MERALDCLYRVWRDGENRTNLGPDWFLVESTRAKKKVGPYFGESSHSREVRVLCTSYGRTDAIGQVARYKGGATRCAEQAGTRPARNEAEQGGRLIWLHVGMTAPGRGSKCLGHTYTASKAFDSDHANPEQPAVELGPYTRAATTRKRIRLAGELL